VSARPEHALLVLGTGILGTGLGMATVFLGIVVPVLFRTGTVVLAISLVVLAAGGLLRMLQPEPARPERRGRD
jgi:hypothetical protein